MRCNICLTYNPPLKKCCMNCGSFLVGRCQNNVTGKWGHRLSDGTFIPDNPREISPSEFEQQYEQKFMMDKFRNALDREDSKVSIDYETGSIVVTFDKEG